MANTLLEVTPNIQTLKAGEIITLQIVTNAPDYSFEINNPAILYFDKQNSLLKGLAVGNGIITFKAKNETDDESVVSLNINVEEADAIDPLEIEVNKIYLDNYFNKVRIIKKIEKIKYAGNVEGAVYIGINEEDYLKLSDLSFLESDEFHAIYREKPFKLFTKEGFFSIRPSLYGLLQIYSISKFSLQALDRPMIFLDKHTGYITINSAYCIPATAVNKVYYIHDVDVEFNTQLFIVTIKEKNGNIITMDAKNLFYLLATANILGIKPDFMLN